MMLQKRFESGAELSIMPDIRFDSFPVLRDSPMMKRMLKRG